MKPTVLTIPDLILRATRELRDADDTTWKQEVDKLVYALTLLPLAEEQIMREVVATSAVLHQFLLELAVRPSPGRPVGLILDEMATLLSEPLDVNSTNQKSALISD